jgi:hypothetical protein
MPASVSACVGCILEAGCGHFDVRMIRAHVCWLLGGSIARQVAPCLVAVSCARLLPAWWQCPVPVGLPSQEELVLNA